MERPRARPGPPLRFIAPVIAFTLVFAGLFSVLSNAGDPPPMQPHAPITISSNDEFIPANGVRDGDGTLAYPWVISDWEIVVEDSNGITISNTDDYFQIRNVRICSTPTGQVATGIHLEGAHNGWIDKSYVNDTQYGVDVWYSDNIRITDLTVFDCELSGVWVYDCHQVRVLNSSISASPGILAQICSETCTELVLTSNSVSNIDSGTNGADVSGYSNVVIQNNTFSNCCYAVSLSGDDDCKVKGNLISTCTYGVKLEDVTDSNVSGNLITGCTYFGIHGIGVSSGNEIFSNTVTSCGGGMLFEGGTTTTIVNNTFRDNVNDANLGGGVTLAASTSGFKIYANRFTDNTPFQAYDNSALNRWNETYGMNGNFWDNHTSPDAKDGPNQDGSDPDGIVDVPYQLDPDTLDEYPLVNEPAVNIHPVASFTASSGPYLTGESISLDASGSWDPSTPGSGVVMYRWDWEGDGFWDTSWSSSHLASHWYWYPGNFTIWLEVMDTGGLCNLTQMEIEVTGEVIPEFSEIMIPVTMMILVFAVVSYRRRFRS